MAKYAFLGHLADPRDPTGVPAAPEAWYRPDASLEEQVAWCVAIKAAVVSSDEREGGRRMALNYGHTLAHALEAAAFGSGPRWDLRHGEAVGVGLVFAAMLAHRLGRIDETRVEAHRTLVRSFGLPTALPADADLEELLMFMGRDKKARHDLTFVLDGPTGVEPVGGVHPDDVLATLADLGRDR
jgi:5-deoxy-5-amino-3-dehydroquinate synthase